MRVNATQEEIQIWIARYLQGETARDIAKDTSFSESTVARRIKEAGFSRGKGKTFKVQSAKPQVVEDFKQGMYCKDIAQKYDISEHTVYKILDEAGLQRMTGIHGKANQNYFSKIDTPNKAYILGFIAADGSVGGKYENTLSIEVHEKDKDVLEFIRSEINPNATITPCFYGKKTNYKVAFSGKQIFSDLGELGIVPNKSLQMPDIPVDLIPKHLLRFYFRGLIDGDGSISEHGRVSIYSGTKSFIENVQSILVKEIGVQKLGIYHGTTYFIAWDKLEDKQKLYDYLYGEHLKDTYYYPRKFERIHKFLYGNTEVNDSIAKGESSLQSVEGE